MDPRLCWTLKCRIAVARDRLARLKVERTAEQGRVRQVQALLFKRLRLSFEKRDRLRLALGCRRRSLVALAMADDQAAQQTAEDLERARLLLADEYERTDSVFRQERASTDLEPYRAAGEGVMNSVAGFSGSVTPPPEERSIDELRRILAGVEAQVLSVEREIDALRQSQDYDLCKRSDEDAGLLEEIVEGRKATLELEAQQLAAELQRLDGLAQALKNTN